MADVFDNLKLHLRELAERAAHAQAKRSVDRIKQSLSHPGSPVPFVAAAAGQPSYNWYGNMVDAITSEVELFPDRVVLTVVSDAVDEHDGNRHFSKDAELGGKYWDGWAYVPQTGQMEKVAPARITEPHPHMGPEVERLGGEAAAQAVSVITQAA